MPWGSIGLHELEDTLEVRESSLLGTNKVMSLLTSTSSITLLPTAPVPPSVPERTAARDRGRVAMGPPPENPGGCPQQGARSWCLSSQVTSSASTPKV